MYGQDVGEVILEMPRPRCCFSYFYCTSRVMNLVELLLSSESFRAQQKTILKEWRNGLVFFGCKLGWIPDQINKLKTPNFYYLIGLTITIFLD